MSIDKLKLSKRLHANMNDLGYFTAKEFQLKSLSRIIGGHSLIGIAPEGAGKTSAYVLGVLMRMKYTQNEPPKVLILAPNEERINEIVDRFRSISKNKNLPIIGLRASGTKDEELQDLALGVDIVVATPNRARSLYLKLGLNLNRIQTFIVDDAEEIVKQGMQTNVRELAQSCGEVQYLAFSSVEHEKLHLMLDPFMPFATLIEVEDLAQESAETHELMRYQVPNFTTKINLLNALMRDEEVFDKVVVFVNTRQTAQNLFQRLHIKKGAAAVLHPFFHDDQGFDSVADFKANAEARLLIVAHEGTEDLEITDIPFLIYFEVPEQRDAYLKHAIKTKAEEESFLISFATDLELPDLKKIEQALGKKIPVEPLPNDVAIYNPSTSTKQKTERDETQGGAFHKKKESNSKTYNYGGGTKAKMTMRNKNK